MAAPSYVYDLIASETARWGGAAPKGTPITITYSFPTTQTSFTNYTNFTQFNATEITATHRALDYISSFTNITFVEVSANAELRFGNADLTSYGDGVGGRATYYADANGIHESTVVMQNAGPTDQTDASFEPGGIAANDIGGFAWLALLHEIGHALGLKHSFERNDANDPASVMPADVENHVNTVMSYASYKPSNVGYITPAGDEYYFNALKPETYSRYDIAALQYFYGANPNSAGGKSYVFKADDPIYMTISDDGPNNTIDVSDLTGRNRIDLTPGSFSDLAIKQTFPANYPITDRYDGTKALAIAYGVDVANVIGGAGADHITGNSIANNLKGGAGADTLIGGIGADTMTGGADSDLYYVDNVGDRVIEAANAGTDKVISSISFSLAGQQIENLQLTGGLALSATGNSLKNILIGNTGANRIDGLQGADTMQGGLGDDTYVVDNIGDRITEAANGGYDSVESSVSYNLAGLQVERLTLIGAAAISATGNSLANTLAGNDAANVIDGGGGADRLRGNGGADRFVFSSALTSSNVDQIIDFKHVDDVIALDDIAFAGLTPGATFTASMLRMAGDASIATTSAQRVIYDTKSGSLFFDRDGSGTAYSAIKFATLTGAPSIDHTDFVVV